MHTETHTCPRCGARLDSEFNLVHDGYRGSSRAHDGRGSYGMGRHHYFWWCECGWVERAVPRRRVARAGVNPKWNGVKLPPGTGSMAECEVLRCESSRSRVENLAEAIGRESGEIGHGTGHSLCASLRYVIVPRGVLVRAEGMLAAGGFAGCRWVGDYRQVLRRDEVYDCDEH